MTRRDFGQHCGLARALELVGERWALLIVRELIVRGRRYTDLLDALPGIPTNVLATRLRELERSGIVSRLVAPAPQRGVIYALTVIGRELEPAIFALGRWGNNRLGQPRPGEVVTPESVALNLRAIFRADQADGLTASWQIHAGDIVLHARVTNGLLDAGTGPAPGRPDLIITVNLADDELPSYRAIVQAVKCGMVTLNGGRDLLGTFLRLFTVPQAA